MVAVLKDLHTYWQSDGNPNHESCAKHFMSRERGVTGGVMVAFTPAKVMVMHEVLLTAESASDMRD